MTQLCAEESPLRSCPSLAIFDISAMSAACADPPTTPITFYLSTGATVGFDLCRCDHDLRAARNRGGRKPVPSFFASFLNFDE